MKNSIQLEWQHSGLPLPLKCVLVLCEHTNCVFTAYLDLDGTWREWTFHPAPLHGTDRSLGFDPTCWTYLTDSQQYDNQCSTLSQVLTNIDLLTTQCPKTLEQRGLKLGEETGELQRAITIETQAPGTKYREYDPEELLQECADVFIVTMSILRHHLDMPFAEYSPKFIAMVEKKLRKWKHILDSEGTSNVGDN